MKKSLLEFLVAITAHTMTKLMIKKIRNADDVHPVMDSMNIFFLGQKLWILIAMISVARVKV